MSLVLKIIIFIAVFIVGIIAIAVHRINESGKSEEVDHQDSDLETKTPKTDILSRQEEVSHRRQQLEECIISLIGGKTGMKITWGEIMKWASQGDVKNFHCFADTFPKKAEYLEKVCDELMSIIEEPASRLYGNEEECKELIDNSKSLKEILNKGTIDEKELIDWYERVKK